MVKNVELEAIRTIQNKGLGYIVVKAPLFLRLFKKTIKLNIPAPTANTYSACTEYYLLIGLTPEQALATDFSELLKKYVDGKKYATRLIARMIINSTFWGFFFTRLLSWYIGENLPVATLSTAARVAVVNGGIEDFCNFIGLAQKMNIMSQTSQQTNPTS